MGAYTNHTRHAAAGVLLLPHGRQAQVRCSGLEHDVHPAQGRQLRSFAWCKAQDIQHCPAQALTSPRSLPTGVSVLLPRRLYSCCAFHDGGRGGWGCSAFGSTEHLTGTILLLLLLMLLSRLLQPTGRCCPATRPCPWCKVRICSCRLANTGPMGRKRRKLLEAPNGAGSKIQTDLMRSKVH